MGQGGWGGGFGFGGGLDFQSSAKVPHGKAIKQMEGKFRAWSGEEMGQR
jgi:hypothetical protein